MCKLRLEQQLSDRKCGNSYQNPTNRPIENVGQVSTPKSVWKDGQTRYVIKLLAESLCCFPTFTGVVFRRMRRPTIPLTFTGV